MKPFDSLTYLGKVRRFRQLAQIALDAYGLSGAQFRLLRMAGNILFRVSESAGSKTRAFRGVYLDGEYLLRIHDPHEQTASGIKLEMEWLTAICRDTGLPVPKPVMTRDGNLFIQATIPGLPVKYDCTLLRWVDGQFINKGIKPRHFRAQGRLMAQLHNHAAEWKPSRGLVKRCFDWDGLFKADAGAGFPNGREWPLLPYRYRQPYRKVVRKVREVMNRWGKDADVYGLIHGDCGVDANVLFRNGEARIIDFDGSGFGYYIYDLSLALEHCWDDTSYTAYREALLEGYSEFRSLSDEQLLSMDLMLAAFYVYMSLWTAAMDHEYPHSPNAAYRRHRWQKRGLEFIKRHIEGQ